MQSTNTPTTLDADTDSPQVTPISHATMIFNLGGQVIYTDPVGGAKAFAGQIAPNIILITDIHGDHLNSETLSAVSKEDTLVVVPQAVADMLPKNIPGTVVILGNGETVANIHEFAPDLLLLDIWMSGVDGRDICKKLKNQPKTQHIPIIMVSANTIRKGLPKL